MVLDGLRVGGEQAVVARPFVIERRQDQHPGHADLARFFRQAHRIGHRAASRANDKLARQIGFAQGLEQREALVHR